jgi:hypothetical protein
MVVKCKVVGRLPLEHMQEGGLMHVVQIGKVVHVDGVRRIEWVRLILADRIDRLPCSRKGDGNHQDSRFHLAEADGETQS